MKATLLAVSYVELHFVPVGEDSGRGIGTAGDIRATLKLCRACCRPEASPSFVSDRTTASCALPTSGASSSLLITCTWGVSASDRKEFTNPGNMRLRAPRSKSRASLIVGGYLVDCPDLCRFRLQYLRRRCRSRSRLRPRESLQTHPGEETLGVAHSFRPTVCRCCRYRGFLAHDEQRSIVPDISHGTSISGTDQLVPAFCPSFISLQFYFQCFFLIMPLCLFKSALISPVDVLPWVGWLVWRVRTTSLCGAWCSRVSTMSQQRSEHSGK